MFDTCDIRDLRYFDVSPMFVSPYPVFFDGKLYTEATFQLVANSQTKNIRLNKLQPHIYAIADVVEYQTVSTRNCTRKEFDDNVVDEKWKVGMQKIVGVQVFI